MLDDKEYYILMEDIWKKKPLSDPKKDTFWRCRGDGDRYVGT